MKIYTKTGDGGTTGLLGGVRVAKDHLRVEAYGTIDELNAMLGAALAFLEAGDDAMPSELLRTQRVLFDVGAELATPSGGQKARWQMDEAAIQELETSIDRMEAELPALQNFILPGGSKAGSMLHLARTVARRAERCMVRLHAQEELDPRLLRYVNRLSDWLFVASRQVNRRAGQPEHLVKS
ncbi:MAG: cob(I)yrinic acid a,c-diamide adenosyltransferase [Candidatus Sericytochromatia bacterium]|nr:cob(I)yrinic acid a,c-diamide adenosyltransferase [Candidatus Sericytochromatia bacterium]